MPYRENLVAILSALTPPHHANPWPTHKLCRWRVRARMCVRQTQETNTRRGVRTIRRFCKLTVRDGNYLYKPDDANVHKPIVPTNMTTDDDSTVFPICPFRFPNNLSFFLARCAPTAECSADAEEEKSKHREFFDDFRFVYRITRVLINESVVQHTTVRSYYLNAGSKRSRP